MHIAERSLFLAAARVLWAFNIEEPENADRNPILPDINNLVGGATVQPIDFKVFITTRTPQNGEKIRKEWQNCVDNLLDSITKQWRKVPDGMKFSTYVSEKIEV